MMPYLWETVFNHAGVRISDKNDPSVFPAEGRAHGQFFRLVYGVDGDTGIPLTIIPITRRGLRGTPPGSASPT